MATPEPEFFDSDELCRYLRIVDGNGEPDRKRLYWLRYTGNAPPGIRIGGKNGRLIYRRTAVDEWLASRTEHARTAS